MSKNNKIIITVLSVFLVMVIGILKIDFSHVYKISIYNDTNKTIENLELKYCVGNTIKIISKIEPKKFWKYNIDTKNIQGENSVLLTYKDNKGNYYEKCMVGYLEQGYSGKSKAIISKIHDTGRLDIEVK